MTSPSSRTALACRWWSTRARATSTTCAAGGSATSRPSPRCSPPARTSSASPATSCSAGPGRHRGRPTAVGRAARRPSMYRALRPDKTALVVMDQVLRAHQSGRLDEIPLYAMLAEPVEALARRARRITRRLASHGVPARAGHPGNARRRHHPGADRGKLRAHPRGAAAARRRSGSASRRWSADRGRRRGARPAHRAAPPGARPRGGDRAAYRSSSGGAQPTAGRARPGPRARGSCRRGARSGLAAAGDDQRQANQRPDTAATTSTHRQSRRPTTAPIAAST